VILDARVLKGAKLGVVVLDNTLLHLYLGTNYDEVFINSNHFTPGTAVETSSRA
jgi:hypothetical protein